jgi:hypothetical protein
VISYWVRILIFISYTSATVSMAYLAGQTNERNSYQNKQKALQLASLNEYINNLEKSQALNISIIDKLNKDEIQSKSFYEGLKNENNSLSNQLHTCYLSNKQLRLIQRARTGYSTKMPDPESAGNFIGISTTDAHAVVNYSIDQSEWMYICYARNNGWWAYYYGNGGK